MPTPASLKVLFTMKPLLKESPLNPILALPTQVLLNTVEPMELIILERATLLPDYFVAHDHQAVGIV